MFISPADLSMLLGVSPVWICVRLCVCVIERQSMCACVHHHVCVCTYIHINPLLTRVRSIGLCFHGFTLIHTLFFPIFLLHVPFLRMYF